MNLREAFLSQAENCTRLGSPFMGQLMRLAAERLAPGTSVADRLLNWPGDVSPYGASLPLRLAGGLHALVLQGADLSAHYPPHKVDDTALWRAVEEAFVTHEAHLHRWLDNPPQTNEVRRTAMLLPAATLVANRFGLPVILSELGASAGLNLNFDRFCLHAGGETLGQADSPVQLTPEWRGAPAPTGTLNVAERAGVDLNPLDPASPEDQLRLLSYLWPDQPERLARTRAAISLAPPQPSAGDAAEWLETRLATPRPGHLHIVYHTIAWQYFPPQTQARAEAALAQAGEAASPFAPLVQIGIEADDDPDSAAIWMRSWPGGGVKEPLGRADFHGRWVDWRG